MPKAKITTESYRESLLAALKDSEAAADYLNACLDDDDPRVFLLALRDVADAFGGVGSVSKGTGLNRESLYRMLSRAGNPSLESLSAVLDALGLKLSVKAAPSKRRKRKIA